MALGPTSGLPLTVPVPLVGSWRVTGALATLARLFAKVKTSVYLPAPSEVLLRHSTPRGEAIGESGKVMSKGVVMLPWNIRETTLVGASALTVVITVAVLLAGVGSVVSAATLAVFVIVPG